LCFTFAFAFGFSHSTFAGVQDAEAAFCGGGTIAFAGVVVASATGTPVDGAGFDAAGFAGLAFAGTGAGAANLVGLASSCPNIDFTQSGVQSAEADKDTLAKSMAKKIFFKFIVASLAEKCLQKC
jgi:hypothetical protein